MAAMYVGVSGAWKRVLHGFAGVSGAWKEWDASVGSGGAWKAAHASEELAAGAESYGDWANVSEDPENPAWFAAFSVVGTGGTGGYGYLWEITSGGSGATLEEETSSVGFLSCSLPTPPTTGVRCKVTDSSGAFVYSNTLTFSL